MSTSRSPGTPTPSSDHSELPGIRVLTMTFLRVSAAVNVRVPPPESRSPREFTCATSVSMVGVSGVSYTTASGWSATERSGGAGVVTASTFAAYPDSRQRT